ncbi:MAG: PilT/PilU family type 4a pilus ATPase [Gammaproteobacteria bacterium]|nr:PilT/PilU family type 4a pilus ATPase [Gammaproteobacteria bacterium]
MEPSTVTDGIEKAQNFVNGLLKELYDRRGTDLYVIAGAPPTLRVNGQLVRAGKPLKPNQCETLVISLLDERQRRLLKQEKTLNFAWGLPGLARFRVNAYFQRGALSMVFRYIPSEIPEFATLNLPSSLLELITAKRGLVLLVGSAGQGKSTTMASLIGHRNATQQGHIVMVEDPIEFTHNHKKSLVTQREVGSDAQSFGEALRSALRQTPDVIAVGEIRDRESMQLALSAADTGHLCIASLHATNATQAIDRIIHFYDEDQRSHVMMDLASNLNAVIAQRLIQIDEETSRPIVEVMRNTSGIRPLIREGRADEIRPFIARGKEQGMMVFDDGLFELYSEGLIDEEKALLYADSVNDLRLRIRLSKGVGLSDDSIDLMPNR